MVILNGLNKLFNFSRPFAQKHLLSSQYPLYLRGLVPTPRRSPSSSPSPSTGASCLLGTALARISSFRKCLPTDLVNSPKRRVVNEKIVYENI
mmetsp:Transcript_13432/g.18191  ORF Transcript_13432/g.18191 Transcript_13432/m.18191 type:complete len:93 (-) Transcript_13432:114-392(-)